MQSHTDRDELIQAFLHKNQLDHAECSLLCGDASFRRYFRVSTQRGSSVLMDAPPQYENTVLFADVTRELLEGGLYVPRLHAVDTQQGLILMEDLGDTLLSTLLDTPEEEFWLNCALMNLVNMQNAMRLHCADLPVYDEAVLMEEMLLYPKWFIQVHLQESYEEDTLQNELLHLARSVEAQPRAYVHRDYHSRNLFCLPGGVIAMIDYQDRIYGPATYDLISLTRDCYHRYVGKQVSYWHEKIRNQAFSYISREDWCRFCIQSALQRHLKVLGIFARLAHRDGKNAYLADLPLVLDYAVEEAERLGNYPLLLRSLQQQQQSLEQMHA